MTQVFHAGTEDVSFVSRNGATGSTNSAVIRTAFSRASVPATNTTTAVPPTQPSWASPSFAAQSSFWFHGQISIAGVASTTTGCPAVGLADAGGVWRLLIQGAATNAIAIAKRNAAGTVTVLATSATNILTAQNAPSVIDLFVNYAVSGQATLYINGVIVADTGPGVDVTTDSATAIGPYFLGAFGGASGSFWSEVIFQDTDTRGLGLQTLPPVASGTTQSWTPNTVGNINPAAINDANFVSSATANQLSEWTVSTTLPAGSWTIEAIVQAARVNAGATGPQHYEFLVRTNDGSDHVQGTTTPPIGSFGNATSVWMVNPFTGVAWVAGGLIQAGIESLA